MNGPEYVVADCPSCGIRYYIPKITAEEALRVRDNKCDTSRKIYCPNGHTWHYLPLSEQDKKKREADEIVRLKKRIDELELQLEAANRLNRELGGNVTALPVTNARKV